MEILEIPREQYEFVTEPALFDQVLIPDEVLCSIESDINEHFMDPFRALRAKACTKTGPFKAQKLYLSRQHFSKTWEVSDGLNEEYY